ncbi:MAG: tetratricopeptide repeat protein, partial [bacterium]
VKLINNNWQAFYLLYLDYLNLNDKEKALFYLEKAYELNPKDTKIIADLFKIYVDTKQIQKAEKFLNTIKNFVKDIELLKRVIFIYFDKKDYENAFYVFFENKLYTDLNYVLDLVNFIKDKDREIYLSFVYKILNFIDFNQNPEFYLTLQIEYINDIYENNTLQAYEYFNSKIGFNFLETLYNIKNYEDIVNNKLNLVLFKLFLIYLKIVFTLYAEYKSEDYLRKYMEIVEKLKMFNFLFVKENDDLNINVNFILFITKLYDNITKLYDNITKLYDNILNSSSDIINNIVLFYTLIFNFNYISLVFNFRDYILSRKNFVDFKNFVVIKVFEDLIPLLIENEVNNIAMDFIDLFIDFNYSTFLKYKIDILDLENKSKQVLGAIEKYYSLFSYNSYIELIKIKNLINLGELKEIVKNDLEKLVLEFNPLAMTLYANIVIFEDRNQAFKLLDKAFEIIIEDKFKFQYSYELLNTVMYLSKVYSKYYSIYKLVKYLNELSKKFYNNYRINYLLAYYLYLIEEFVDAEVIAKKLVKLAKTNNLLVEAQKLLATIKSERENYNKFLLTLENNFKGITVTISSYLNLIKKGKIEEVLKYLESIDDDTKIENIIIKAILYDKLEIYQHFIYYYNLFRIWALDNNLDDLIDFIDKKLYNYSNLADFEELKLKAQINYSSLFKQKEYLQKLETQKLELLEQLEKTIDINQNIPHQLNQHNELDQIDNLEDISNIQLDSDLLEKTLDSIQLNQEELENQLENQELTLQTEGFIKVQDIENIDKVQEDYNKTQEIETFIKTQETEAPIETNIEIQKMEIPLEAKEIELPVETKEIESFTKTQDIEVSIDSQEIETSIKTQKIGTLIESKEIELPVKTQEIENSIKNRDIENSIKTQEIEDSLENKKIKSFITIPETQTTTKIINQISSYNELNESVDNEMTKKIRIQDNIHEINEQERDKEIIFRKSLIELFESETIDMNLLESYLSNIDKVELVNLDDIIIVNVFYIIYLLKLQERLNLDEIINKIDFNLFLEKRDQFIKQNLSLKEFFNSIIDIELNIIDTKSVLLKLKELMIKFKNQIYYFSFFLFVLSLVYLNLNKISDYKKYFQVILNNFKNINKNMFNFFNFLNNIIIEALKNYVDQN